LSTIHTSQIGSNHFQIFRAVLLILVICCRMSLA